MTECTHEGCKLDPDEVTPEMDFLLDLAAKVAGQRLSHRIDWEAGVVVIKESVDPETLNSFGNGVVVELDGEV